MILTRTEKLRRALHNCLRVMAKGRPADPKDSAEWDRTVLLAQDALALKADNRRAILDAEKKP